MNSPGPQCP